MTGLTSRNWVILGDNDLREMLNDLAPNQAKNLLRAVVHDLAGKVRDEIKERAPVLSGDMRASIKTVRKRASPENPVSEVRGGGTAPYVYMTEFGTSHSKAQPFIGPTVEFFRPRMINEYRQSFGAKLEKMLARQAKKALG